MTQFTDQVLRQCWYLLETEGINGLTVAKLQQFLPHASVTLQHLFPQDALILGFMWHHVLQKVTVTAPYGQPQDCLFESLMSLTDCLLGHEPAISRLLADLPYHPRCACYLNNALTPWIQQTLEQSGLSKGPVGYALTDKALKGVVFLCLGVWGADITPDKSETMHMLNQYLETFMQFYNALETGSFKNFF